MTLRPDDAYAHRLGRIAAGVMAAFAIAYGVGGATIEYAFSSDPIGPRGFPVALALSLGLLSLWYFLRPGEAEKLPAGPGARAALSFLVLIVATTLLIPYAGFITAMFVMCAGVARLFGGSWMQSTIGGAVQAVLWWAVFGPLLGSHLPSGPLGF